MASETVSRDPVTANPPVSKPPTQPCRVFLTENQPFTDPSTPYIGPYSPPTSCPSPWALAVLEWNGSIAQTQIDRAGALWINRIEIFRTTTPTSTGQPIAWHVEKNVSEYASVLSQPGEIRAIVTNALNKDNPGIIYLTTVLDFYPVDTEHGPLFQASNVIPVARESALPWFILDSPQTEAQATLHLPTNIRAAYLEVYATGHGCDEFWYVSSPITNPGCGTSAHEVFREIQVLVDGRIIGAVWPFPLIYTGLFADLWRPIPAVNALNIPPYTLDLTPLAGLLADGATHAISLRITSNRGFWLIDANLLVFQDTNGQSTMGLLLSDKVQPNATKQTRVAVDRFGINGVSVITTAERDFTITGYVDTSTGRSTTSVQQNMTFKDEQEWRIFNLLGYLSYDVIISTRTSTVDLSGTTTIHTLIETRHLGIRISNGCPQATLLPITVDQLLLRTAIVNATGQMLSSGSIRNQIHAVMNGETREQYAVSTNDGPGFYHYLSASHGTVTTDLSSPRF